MPSSTLTTTKPHTRYSQLWVAVRYVTIPFNPEMAECAFCRLQVLVCRLCDNKRDDIEVLAWFHDDDVGRTGIFGVGSTKALRSSRNTRS